MKGCKIDFVKKTLTITKEFEDKMQDMNSYVRDGEKCYSNASY